MAILVGFQVSPAGAAALKAAVEEAQLRSTSLTIANVPGDEVVFDRTTLDAALEQCRVLGVETTVLRIVGDRQPADRLVQEAATGQYSLLVLGVRHRSAVGKMLLGSAEQHVLLNSPISVLAAKPLGADADEVWRVVR